MTTKEIDTKLNNLQYEKSVIEKEINELKKLINITESGFGDNDFFKEKAAKANNLYLKEYYNKNAILIDINMSIDELNNKKIVNGKITEFNAKDKDIDDKLKDVEYIDEDEIDSLCKYVILSKGAEIKYYNDIIAIYDDSLLVNTMSDELYRCSFNTDDFNDNLYKYFKWRNIIKEHKLFKIKPVNENRVINGYCDFVVKNEAVYARIPAVIIISKTGYVTNDVVKKIIDSKL